MPGLIDEAVGAACELVEPSQNIGIGRVGADEIEIRTGTSIELDELLQLAVRQLARRQLCATQNLVELLPDGRARGNQALDVHLVLHVLLVLRFDFRRIKEPGTAPHSEYR